MSRLCGALLLAVASMAQSPNPGLAPPGGHSALEGTVVDASSHEPIKKAKVALAGRPAVAFTDGSGHFVFRELYAGTYWLMASKEGYTSAKEARGQGVNRQFSLGTDETKKGIEIALDRGGSISGRVLNEDGQTVRHCDISPVQPVYRGGRRELQRVGYGADTDDKGLYQISGLAPGRYYLFARCRVQLPAAHPLMPRGDPRIPHDTYIPQFYGGAPDPASATRVQVAVGANLEGIDFEVHRVRAFTLRGSLTAMDPSALPENVNVMLTPINPAMTSLMESFTRTFFPSRAFQLRPVVPGSYRLVAFGRNPGHPAYAERTVEIGSVPPDPIDLMLSTGADLKGSMQFDSDNYPIPDHLRLSLTLLDSYSHVPQVEAEVSKDGTFNLAGVLPGHWVLTVPLFGYIKSLSLGGQQVSPYDFLVPPGASGPLHVSMGTKMADVRVTVTGIAPGSQVSLLAFPEEPDRMGAGLERTFTGGSQLTLAGLPPGRYRLLASDSPSLWTLRERPDLLKAVEGSTQAIEVPESGRVSATVELVPDEELTRVLAEKEP